jgi:alkanesulfonate monooxygenase SsuD/methylene tetrahydromethanopterin reductase-like flavin-dependent oxidoreductase (luciferase family)
MRVGVQLPEVERVVRWPEYRTMALAAEEVGFDSVWVGDHLLYRGDGREERGPWDAWTVMAAIAPITTRVQIGPLVACSAFSPPGLLARRAAAIAEVSAGRFVLGIGSGWNETEFRSFGLPYDHLASRFEERFEIVRRLLAGERVTFHGRYDTVEEAVLLPAPLSPVPVMIGSTGERVLRATLPHVNAWNIWHDWYGNTVEGFAEATSRIDELCRDIGRPPGEVLRTATVSVRAGTGAAQRPHVSVAPIHADAIVDHLAALAGAGCDEAILVLDPIDEPAIRRLGPFNG